MFALESLPDDLRTLVETNTSLGFSCIDEYQIYDTEKTQTVSGSGYGVDGAANGAEADYVHDSNYWDWDEEPDDWEAECVLSSGGVLEADNPPASDYVDTYDGGFYLGAGNNRNITANSIQALVTVPLV